MPLLNATEIIERKKLHVELPVPLINNIKTYCDWANIHTADEFLAQAAEFILKKDKGWQTQQKDGANS